MTVHTKFRGGDVIKDRHGDQWVVYHAEWSVIEESAANQIPDMFDLVSRNPDVPSIPSRRVLIAEAYEWIALGYNPPSSYAGRNGIEIMADLLKLVKS